MLERIPQERMDEVVVFGPLHTADLARIAERLLTELEGRAAARGYRLTHSPELPALLAGREDPVYGARELRRAVSRAVEQALADSIASGEAAPGGSFTACAQDGRVVLRPAGNPAGAQGSAPPARANAPATV